MWPQEKVSSELVACCAMECQKAAEEATSTAGTSPRGHSGDRHRTRLVGENKSQGPGWGAGVQYGVDGSIMPHWAHPAASNWDFRGSSLAACLSQNCFCLFLLPYAGNGVEQAETVSQLTSISHWPITSLRFSLPLGEIVPQRLPI